MGKPGHTSINQLSDVGLQLYFCPGLKSWFSKWRASSASFTGTVNSKWPRNLCVLMYSFQKGESYSPFLAVRVASVTRSCPCSCPVLPSSSLSCPYPHRKPVLSPHSYCNSSGMFCSPLIFPVLNPTSSWPPSVQKQTSSQAVPPAQGPPRALV